MKNLILIITFYEKLNHINNSTIFYNHFLTRKKGKI